MNDYPTIQYVPVAAILPEFEKLHKEIARLHARFDRNESIMPDAEVCAALGISETTLWRWKNKGKINSIRTPNGLAVRVCDLEGFRANNPKYNKKV